MKQPGESIAMYTARLKNTLLLGDSWRHAERLHSMWNQQQPLAATIISWTRPHICYQGQHLASECKFKQAKCYLCRKKGQVCWSQQQTNSASAGSKLQSNQPRQGRTHLVGCTQQPSGKPNMYSLFAVTGHSSNLS